MFVAKLVSANYDEDEQITKKTRSLNQFSGFNRVTKILNSYISKTD